MRSAILGVLVVALAACGGGSGGTDMGGGGDSGGSDAGNMDFGHPTPDMMVDLNNPDLGGPGPDMGPPVVLGMASCSQLMGVSDACPMCIGTHCCTEYTACMGSSTCSTFLMCTNGCMDGTCVAGCMSAAGGDPTTGALIGCVQGPMCMSACGG